MDWIEEIINHTKDLELIHNLPLSPKFGKKLIPLIESDIKKLAQAIRKEMEKRLPEEKEFNFPHYLSDWKGGYNTCLKDIKERLGI